VKVGFYGFGQINRLVARLAIERGWELVSAVDTSRDLVGRDVGEVMGVGRVGVRVSSDPGSLKGSDVVFHATTSYLDGVFNQLVSAVRTGCNVVSTCETLAYPYLKYPELARRLNELARARGVTVLGTGINPGFIMDTLIVVLSAPHPFVRRVKGVRSFNALKRRESFQRKVGLGLRAGEFRELLRRGVLTGHVGYAESVALIASSMGVKLERVVEGQEPVVADREIVVSGRLFREGEVLGVRGYGHGYVNGRPAISLEVQAHVTAEDFEEVVVEGRDFTVEWRSSGTPGDLGTAAVLVNLAEYVSSCRPGLITMADVIPFRPRLLA